MDGSDDSKTDSEKDTETLISNFQDFVDETEELCKALHSQLSEHPQYPKDFGFVDALSEQDFYDSLRRLEAEWGLFQNEAESEPLVETESKEDLCGAAGGKSKSSGTSFSDNYKTRFQNLLMQELRHLRRFGAKMGKRIRSASRSRSRERTGEPSGSVSRFQEKFQQVRYKLEKLRAALRLFRLELQIYEKLINGLNEEYADEESSCSLSDITLKIVNCDEVIKKRHIISHLYYALRCELSFMKEEIMDLNAMKKGIKIEGTVLRRMEKTKKIFVRLRKMAEHEYHNVHKKINTQNPKEASVLAAVKKFFSTEAQEPNRKDVGEPSAKGSQKQSEIPKNPRPCDDITEQTSGREQGAIPKRPQGKQSVKPQNSPVKEKRYPTRATRKQQNLPANVGKRSSDLEALHIEELAARTSGKQSPAKQLKRTQAKSSSENNKLIESSSAMDETDGSLPKIASVDIETPAATDESSKDALSNRFDSTLSEMHEADSNSSGYN